MRFGAILDPEKEKQRQRVVDYLRDNPESTVAKICKGISMDQHVCERHVDALERCRSVRKTAHEYQGGWSKRKYVYSLIKIREDTR